MRATIFFPARNISHKHSGAHDVLEARAKSLQSSFDIPKTLLRLLVRVIAANDFAIITERGRSRYVDSISDFHCARVTNDRFPLRAGRDSFTVSHAEPSLTVGLLPRFSRKP